MWTKGDSRLIDASFEKLELEPRYIKRCIKYPWQNLISHVPRTCYSSSNVRDSDVVLTNEKRILCVYEHINSFQKK